MVLPVAAAGSRRSYLHWKAYVCNVKFVTGAAFAKWCFISAFLSRLFNGQAYVKNSAFINLAR